MRSITLMITMATFIACGSDRQGSSTTESSKLDEKAEKKIEHQSRRNKSKGIGPVSELKLPKNVAKDMVVEGKKVFDAKCTACHKPTKKYIGPALKGIMKRRSPEWIMNMILNPEEMLKKDPVAKQLYRDYNGAVMANQDLTEDEARKILEYFRTLE